MSAEISVSHTKIVIPTLRPEILHRRRLLALFDDLLDRKLIIVLLPPVMEKHPCWWILPASPRYPPVAFS